MSLGKLFLVLLQKQVFYSSTSNLVKKSKVWEENNEKCKKMIFQEGFSVCVCRSVESCFISCGDS